MGLRLAGPAIRLPFGLLPREPHSRIYASVVRRPSTSFPREANRRQPDLRRSRSRRGRMVAAGVGAFLTLGFAACGSATATDRGSTATRATASAHVPVGLADTTSPTTTAATTTPPTTAPAPAACASTVAGTLGTVGERIYREASTGGNVSQAVHRVRSSSALASAINTGDTAAARAALRTLLVNQIVRVEVLRGGHVFASAGSGPAIAPVRGSIPGTRAGFVLSVQSDHAYTQVARQVTGTQVLLLSGPASGGAGARRLAGTIGGPPPATIPQSGPLSYGGRTYQVASLAGAVYPSGSLRIALLVPTSEISCPASIAQARVETLGHVGERIYQEELGSTYVAATVRRMEHTPSFVAAAAAHDVTATQAAIIGFFRAHIHIVRVRVTVGSSKADQRLLTDVGGPYALAPVHGTLRSNGHMVGTFTTAIQDDAGYLKLAHLFTGADVLMRTGGRQVMGTLSPGPATVPDRGQVSYGRRAYQAYSFTGEAFPSGPLRLSLLIAA